MCHRFLKLMWINRQITAKVVDLNEADRKISLSMKVLETASELVETESVEDVDTAEE